MKTYQTTGARALAKGVIPTPLPSAPSLAPLPALDPLAALLLPLDDGASWLPIRAFRLGTVRRVTSLPQVAFLSSGSTQSTRARHLFSQVALDAYARASAAGFVTFLARAGLAADTPLVSLVPRPSAWPTSSLAAMIAFFSREGLNVRWCDVDAAPDARAAAEGLLMSLRKALSEGRGDVVVFGTSVHHLLVARAVSAFGCDAPFARTGRLLVVDTGGTKGRTDALTPDALRGMIESTYAPFCRELLVGSEYGMCELASQAYSAAFPHDGRFVCNPTFEVRAVDPATRRVLPLGQLGFLAFVDTLNAESHTHVVTEDLGIAHDAHTFTLHARAPDASLKGCSLNVKGSFLFADDPVPSPFVRTPSTGTGTSATPPARGNAPMPMPGSARTAERTPPFRADDALAALARAGVSASLRDDLAPALRGIEPLLPTLVAQRAARLSARGEVPPLVLVASANVPVVVLYPLVWAWAAGVSTCVIKFPSLRVEDPLAGRIRACMEALLAALAAALPGLAIARDDALSSAAAALPDARYLVFGTDTTVETFEARLGARVQGLGDVTNAIDLRGVPPDPALDRLVHDASRYFGRGCLTPVAAVADAALGANTIADALSARLVARYREEGCEDLARLLHHQDAAEVRYLLARAGVAEPSLLEHARPAARVFDLRGLAQDFPFHHVPLAAGGSGFLYLFPPHALGTLGKSLGFHPTNPGPRDPHVGDSWDVRLERLLFASAGP